MVVAFELEGQAFMALDGGPILRLHEAISLQIGCETRQEVDRYREKLGQGGDPTAQQYGWLEDRYGLSWQVTPVILTKMLQDPDAGKANRVMQAVLDMKKIDTAALQRAYAG